MIAKLAQAVLKLILPDVMCMVKDQLKEMAKDIHPPKDSPITKEQVDEILGFMKKMKKTQNKFKIG